MLDKIISYSFYLLFLLTPLFWTPLNYELFEYNKMIVVYALTTVIVGSWVLKMINDKRLTVKRTPLDIPLLLFLGANILSTIFSIDHHTSTWGYYSRSNGGLLSLISYLLLYFSFVSNMDKDKVLKILKFGLISGFIISVWGIAEHFGVSPSCIILRGEFNANCWIQDVQARVFATLGQPNWMAAYLSMLIFPALYFFLTASTRKKHLLYFVSLLTMYLAFTFTYSRGPTLGLIGGLVVFILLLLKISNFKFQISNKFIKNYKALFLVLGSFIIINILFGSALTSFRLVSKFAPPPRPTIGLTPSVTQLENGGTESGQIRFIVWEGALNIFRHYPIFGSGVETFAYSYYQYRPATHNLTSEWDFLYNKAHNEYLNYLATTGIVGFGAYLFLIVYFVYWAINKIVTSKGANEQTMLIALLLGSYTSYLIYNFFLFSVVILAVFFFCLPALIFVATDSIREIQIFNFIHSRKIYTQAAVGFTVFMICYFLFAIYRLWWADTFFAKGEKASEAGNPGKAYNLLVVASDLNTGEPFYRSELAYSAAAASAALAEKDATLSAALKDEAISQTDQVFKQSPNNVSFLRTAVRTYFELASNDKTYLEQTLKIMDKAIQLAPTDPKLYYNKALILDSQGKKDEATAFLHKALELKANYLEPQALLKEATASAKP